MALNPIELAITVAALIRQHRFVFNNEAELQTQVADLLASNALLFEREFPISLNSRPDFFSLHSGLVIEVKVDGSAYQIGRQLQRYATHPRVHAILLITSRPIALPPTMHGKPVTQASTWLSALGSQ